MIGDQSSFVVLAIDPGRTSGWAIMALGRVVASGVATSHEGRTMAVDLAEVEATRRGLPLVVCAEKWTAGGWASHATLIGLGAAWGAWRECLESAGVPKSRIVRVTPQVWRARVLSAGNRAGSVALKAMSVRRATLACGHEIDHDEADAVCIGLWASHADEVCEVAAKKVRRKSPTK